MKRSFLILTLALIQIININVWSATPDIRRHLLIDKNWKFTQSDVKGAEVSDFDDAKWRTLNLPHDWSIEGEFKVEGEGVLIGTDNGNPQDKTQMKIKQRNAYNGLALVVIQSTEKGGNIRLTTVSKGLKDAVLQVVSAKLGN